MSLKPELFLGVYAHGYVNVVHLDAYEILIIFQSFERPFAIQRAIAPIIKGHDVIAQAQPGAGKTATLSISVLQQVRRDPMAIFTFLI